MYLFTRSAPAPARPRGCLGCLSLLFWTAAGLFVALVVLVPRDPGPTPTRVPAAPASVDLLPAVGAWFEDHDDYGRPARALVMPDWFRGRRQRVQTDRGYSLLFYLREDRVVTVYEDARGPRRVVWEASER